MKKAVTVNTQNLGPENLNNTAVPFKPGCTCILGVTGEFISTHTSFFQSKCLHNSFQFPLESFLKGDIKGVKGDLRKPFDKAWKDYESR